jgi:hypothetical protein
MELMVVYTTVAQHFTTCCKIMCCLYLWSIGAVCICRLAVYMSSLLFWYFTQRRLLFFFFFFFYKISVPLTFKQSLNMELVCWSETSVTNYQSMLSKIPEKRISQIKYSYLVQSSVIEAVVFCCLFHYFTFIIEELISEAFQVTDVSEIKARLSSILNL